MKEKKYDLFFRIKIKFYLIICNLDLKLMISIHKLEINYIIDWYNKYIEIIMYKIFYFNFRYYRLYYCKSYFNK